MEITDIRIRLMNEEKLKAFANIVLDDCFAIKGMKVIAGKNGYFVSMPSRKVADGSHIDVAHPIKSEVRNMFEETILKAYANELSRNGDSGRI